MILAVKNKFLPPPELVLPPSQGGGQDGIRGGKLKKFFTLRAKIKTCPPPGLNPVYAPVYIYLSIFASHKDG